MKPVEIPTTTTWTAREAYRFPLTMSATELAEINAMLVRGEVGPRVGAGIESLVAEILALRADRDYALDQELQRLATDGPWRHTATLTAFGAFLWIGGLFVSAIWTRLGAVMVLTGIAATGIVVVAALLVVAGEL